MITPNTTLKVYKQISLAQLYIQPDAREALTTFTVDEPRESKDIFFQTSPCNKHCILSIGLIMLTPS